MLALDKAGRSALHLAATDGNADVASLLLEHGADVAAKHDGGVTPLHLCASSDPACVSLLLSAGANAEERDASGQTALHLAVSGAPMPRVEAAAQLQEVQPAAVAWMVGPRSPPLRLVSRPTVRPLQLRRRAHASTLVRRRGVVTARSHTRIQCS